MTLNPAKMAMDVGLIVSDIEASLDFYVGFLGLEQLGELEIPFGHMHRLGFGASVIKLTVPNLPPHSASGGLTEVTGMRYLTFAVTNIVAVNEAAKKRGLPVELPLQEWLPKMMVLMLRDPDGNVVELIQRP